MSFKNSDTANESIEHNYIQLGNRDVDLDEMEYGVRYRGIINGVTGYGAFVTLANMGEPEKELVGLSHAKFMPPMYSPEDYSAGDVVGVMVTNLPDDGRVQLEIVSHIHCSDVPKAEFEPTAAKATPEDQLITYDNEILELAHIEAGGNGTARETAELLRTVSNVVGQLPEEAEFDVDITLTDVRAEEGDE